MAVMGVFNVTLFLEDSSFGSSRIDVGVLDFRECTQKIKCSDIKGLGMHYTWSQKPKEGTGILKKLDRIMANTMFIDAFPAACAVFKPYRISDHCPCILQVPITGRSKAKPFKFANFLASKPGFLGIVKAAWDT
jgi:hypothetical protein